MDTMLRIAVAVVFLISAFVFAETSPVLTLIETNGVSLEGRIASYSTQSESVKIKTQNGQVQRPLSAFTSESQQEISLWRADREFLKDTRLVASFSEAYESNSSNIIGTVTTASVTESNRVIGVATRSLYSCKINLVNKSDFSYNDLQVEYRVFFTQHLSAEFSVKCQLSGCADVNALEPGSSWEVSTTPIVKSITYRSTPGISWSRRPNSIDSVIEGVLLCVRKKGAAGEWVERIIEHGTVPSGRNRRSYQKIYKSLYDGPDL